MVEDVLLQATGETQIRRRESECYVRKKLHFECKNLMDFRALLVNWVMLSILLANIVRLSSK
jgi:hypothetical protein